MIDRSTERTALDELADRVRGGSRQGLLMLGEEGMGKTTLLSDSIPRFVNHGLHVVCIVQSPFSTSSLSITTRSKSKSETHVTIPDADFGPDLLQFVESLNASGVILLVDDFDRLSPEAARAIQTSFKVSTHPIALLASSLPAGSPSSQSVTLPAPSSDAWIDYLLLEPFAEAHTQELASWELGGPVLPSLTIALQSASQGNPLHVKELLRYWGANELLGAVGSYWYLRDGEASSSPPHSLQELAGLRMAELDGDSLRMLQILTLFQRPVSYPELRAIDSDPALPELLSTLVHQALVAEEATVPPRYSLRHPLYGLVALNRMTLTRRGMLHESIYSGLTSYSSKKSARELAHHGLMTLTAPPDLVHTLKRAVDESRDSNDLRSAARFAHEWAARAETNPERVRAYVASATATVATSPSDAIAAYDSALRYVEAGDETAALLIGRAAAFRRRGEFRNAMADLESAREESTSAETLFDIRHALAALAGIRRDYEQAESMLHGLAAEAPDSSRLAKALGHLAQVSYSKGSLQDALSLAASALDSPPDGDYRLFLESNLAWYAILLGQWRTAGDVLEDAIQEASDAGDAWNLFNLKADQARLMAWMGDIRSALDSGQEAVRLATQVGNYSDQLHAAGALTTPLIEASAYADALALFSEAYRAQMGGEEPRDLPMTLAQFAEVLVYVGDLRSARDFIREARQALSEGPHFRILVDRIDAQIVLHEGNPAHALELLTGTLEVDSHMPLEEAAVRELIAESQRLCGHRDPSIAAAQSAQDMYSQLGATRRCERVSRWLQLNHRRVGRPRSNLPYALTPREMEILWILTKGKTNKEIASALFISEGTVRKHVENIKAKAGVSRRTELVTFAGSIGITPDSVPEFLRRPQA